MDKIEKKKRDRKAWQQCQFCSQSDFKIREMLFDKDCWKEIPLTHKCGWARICQVAFRMLLLSDDIWKEICRERANRNHHQSSYDYSTTWLEDYCETYKKVNNEFDVL